VNIPAHPEAPLTHSQFEELRDCLTNERQELAGSITALNALIDARQDCENRDSGNVASVFMTLVIRVAKKRIATVPEEFRRRACIMAKHHKTMIFEIDAALGRLDEGRWSVKNQAHETALMLESENQ
jgi:hypothetical protein